MNQNEIKIGACIMVHNMAPVIGACIKSLQWTDGIFLFDDLSIDNSIEIAKQNSTIRLVTEKSKNTTVAFEQGELSIRNYVIDRAFEELETDVMIIIDSDEMLSATSKSEIVRIFRTTEADSIALSMWHLYDEKRYLHFWQTEINNTFLIDPHTRIIRNGKHFVSNIADGSHPIILSTEKTVCLHKPFHFHLKYFFKSTFPNYSLYFLPERIKESDATPYLKNLPFALPDDVRSALSCVNWDLMPEYKQTPHYDSVRVKFEDPKEALIHPKDKK